MAKYPKMFSGDVIELEPHERKGRAWQILRFACCDCGLIHSMAFAVEKNGNLGVAVKRENQRTAAHRRAKEFRGLKLPHRK